MSSALSFVSTPAVGSYMYEALPERLRKLAEDDGDREAFVYYDKNWIRSSISRRELFDRSINLAKVLVSKELQNKSAVGICMTNSLNMLVTNMAVVCAGGVPFFTGTNLKDGSDVINVMKDMSCEMLFIDTDADDANWNILENIWPQGEHSATSVPSLKVIICNGDIPEGNKSRVSLSSMFKEIPESSVVLPEVQPEDPLVNFCTSGTTGHPKELTCSHFYMFNWTLQSDFATGISGADIYFNDRTFSWVGGYPRFYITHGTTRVFIDPRITTAGKNINQVADVIEAERCDVVYCPNYIAVDLLEKKHLSPKFTYVRTFLFAGERFPKAYTDLVNNFCQTLAVMYGCTETGGVVVFKSDNIDAYEDGIAGKLFGGVEIKLVDDTGAVVPCGSSGEVYIRDPWRFTGYLGNEALFRKSVDDASWFHTGDIAHIRLDGNIVIDGRRIELISMQTNKFFPWVIEKTLKKIPGALYTFAIGVPDKRSYEAVCACVVPKEGVTMTADDVRKYCDDVFLEESSSMVTTTKPRYHIVLESVPLTKTVKVSRVKIAALARDKLGLQ